VAEPRKGADKPQNQDNQRRRPRGAFIVLGFVLLTVGAILWFLNYSTSPGLAYFGIFVGSVGFGMVLFSPSRKKNSSRQPNGNGA
jgi:hypothetical protein